MLSPFLLHNAYFFLIPLAILEGPVVALLCGVAGALGYIDPFIAWGILVGGDFVPDLMYYWIGRWGATLEPVRRFAMRTKLLRENLPRIETLWREHFPTALTFAKLAYGVSPPLIVSVGLSGMPAWRFALWSLVVSTLYLGSLILCGYGLGQTFGYAQGMFGGAPLFFAIVGICCLLLFCCVAYWARQRLPLRDVPSNIIGH